MSGIIAQNSGRHTGLVKTSSAAGVWNLIETLTASSDATLDFTSGIDSTYDEYVFKFINIHPETDAKSFSFQANAAGGSGFNETITSACFRAAHAENDSEAPLDYLTATDQAQGTAFQNLMENDALGSDNDQCLSGWLKLFAPSDTTFVKQFLSRTNMSQQADSNSNFYGAGYFNTTTAIDEIQFKMNSGNIDAGTISLYGIS